VALESSYTGAQTHVFIRQRTTSNDKLLTLPLQSSQPSCKVDQLQNVARLCGGRGIIDTRVLAYSEGERAMTQIEQTGEISWRSTPVPAARAIEHFSAAEVGDGEYVFLDNERLEYHTLNASAFAVWKLCDGVRTSEEISRVLALSGTPLPVESVDLAVVKLGGAGLLSAGSHSWDTLLTRRRVVKLAAAGALGAAVVPAVSSMTAPVSASHMTCSAGTFQNNITQCAAFCGAAGVISCVDDGHPGNTCCCICGA
jgi:hypothetical protein